MDSDTRVETEDNVLRYRPVMLFGRDVMEIKCFRNSFICGICTGVVGGLGTFLFTSKTLFSTHLSFVSLWVGVFGYWIPCRYKYETNFKKIEEFKKKFNVTSKNEENDSKNTENDSKNKENDSNNKENDSKSAK